MNVSSATAVPATAAPAGRTLANKFGIGISVLIGGFLAFDAVGKLAGFPQVKEGTAALGFPADQALVMGIVLSVCVIVFAIPRTAVLGALGITAYLGGAVAANMRVEAPLLTHTLFAVLFGIVLWIAMVLRRPELLRVAGLTR
ncbi:conserved membrane hypothetical protein [uncultured Mycobacterium sp.]|uniref:DoxX family protein n=1 Tax=uncultured Mycobacterium sp. TaxID=171292 RepID=A0A1Y5PH51_9MYCO|nr:conserved membrane hypothetical protein [uncultured Mycobacterium sp.]